MGAIVLAIAGLLATTASSSPPARALPTIGLPVPPIAITPPTAIGTMDAAHRVLSFHGAVTNPTPLPLVDSPVSPVCEATCAAYTFTAATAAPFLVSVHDHNSSMNNGWDVYVYNPKHQLVGAANGIGANGQAVTIAAPAPGAYEVVITFTYAEDPGASFDGEVRLMEGASWKPPAPTCGITVSGVTGCFLLPVLHVVPASDIHVDGLPPIASTPLGFPLPGALPFGTSCYLDETIPVQNLSAASLQHLPTRCLRFTSDVQNVGAGVLDMRIPWAYFGMSGSVTVGFLPNACHAQQAVVDTYGDVALRPAGDCLFHLAHAHFHYRDLVGFSLYPIRANGSLGPRVGQSQKASFCLADDDYFGFRSPGPNGPRNYVGQPGCNVPSQIGLHGPLPKTMNGEIVVGEGVSPGWGDVYTWDTPDQYIDISNVGPGRYGIVEETNPSGTILVAGPARTCALTQVDLTASAATVVGKPGPVPCPPPA